MFLCGKQALGFTDVLTSLTSPGAGQRPPRRAQWHRKQWSLQGVLNLVLQRRNLPVLQHSQGREKGGTKIRTFLSYLPPPQWFFSYPCEVGKVQEEQNNTCAIRNKLWARQEMQDAAEFQAMVLVWGSVSRLWGDHQTHPIFRYSRGGYFSLARNSALPTGISSFHDLLLTILSEVISQTLHKTANNRSPHPNKVHPQERKW